MKGVGVGRGGSRPKAVNPGSDDPVLCRQVARGGGMATVWSSLSSMAELLNCKCRNYQTPERKLFTNTVGHLRLSNRQAISLLEKFWQISLYATDDAIANLNVAKSLVTIEGNGRKI